MMNCIIMHNSIMCHVQLSAPARKEQDPPTKQNPSPKRPQTPNEHRDEPSFPARHNKYLSSNFFAITLSCFCCVYACLIHALVFLYVHSLSTWRFLLYLIKHSTPPTNILCNRGEIEHTQNTYT